MLYTEMIVAEAKSVLHGDRKKTTYHLIVQKKNL